MPSGFDLNNNGVVAGGDDAFGFGLFPGQFGMVVYSKYPIQADDVRTFQHFLWKDMPGALLPDDPATPNVPQDWYSPAELDVFRLSSKSHWDVPISIGKKTVHFLVSHPTPPVFDGPEDRNGTRNHDEIRFWSDYVTGGAAASYIYDDAGATGGLAARRAVRDRRRPELRPVRRRLHPRFDPAAARQPADQRLARPHEPGGRRGDQAAGRRNLTHESPPQFDTADFADTNPGNLRADYVLPSRQLGILDSAVFWPVTTDPLWRLTRDFPNNQPTDHRMVWVDVHLNHPGA